MRPAESELNEYLQQLLGRVWEAPPLASRDVAQEREKFLASGRIFKTAVSGTADRRHIKWNEKFNLAFQRKEFKQMLNPFMAIVVTFTLMFGGIGTTIYAAQGSTPDSGLYAVKVLGESLALSAARSPQEKLNLTLRFTDRRVDELIGLQYPRVLETDFVSVRLQEQLESAIQIAAGMDNILMMQALHQIRERAQAQAQKIALWTGNHPGQQEPIIQRIQTRLREQVELAQSGEADPSGFRLMVNERMRNRQNSPVATPPSNPPGPTVSPSITPILTGNSYGPGPFGSQATGTAGQYGPGEPDPSQTPVPVGGSYGPGPGSGQPTSTPGGYGPGPQAGTITCTPVQNGGGGGSGPNPTQTPQSSGPGPGQITQPPGQGGKP